MAPGALLFRSVVQSRLNGCDVVGLERFSVSGSGAPVLATGLRGVSASAILLGGNRTRAHADFPVAMKRTSLLLHGPVAHKASSVRCLRYAAVQPGCTVYRRCAALCVRMRCTYLLRCGCNAYDTPWRFNVQACRFLRKTRRVDPRAGHLHRLYVETTA